MGGARLTVVDGVEEGIHGVGGAGMHWTHRIHGLDGTDATDPIDTIDGIDGIDWKRAHRIRASQIRLPLIQRILIRYGGFIERWRGGALSDCGLSFALHLESLDAKAEVKVTGADRTLNLSSRASGLWIRTATGQTRVGCWV